MTMSRTRPSTRDSMVMIPTSPDDLSRPGALGNCLCSGVDSGSDDMQALVWHSGHPFGAGISGITSFPDQSVFSEPRVYHRPSVSGDEMGFSLDIWRFERHSSASFISTRWFWRARDVTNHSATNLRFSGVLRWQIPRKPRSAHVRTRRTASTMQACVPWLVLT